MFAIPITTDMTLVLFVLGVVLGSFGNVLIARIPKQQAITGRSRCPSCRHELGVKDLVPLFSYFFLRGRCSYCGTPISPQYPIVEMLSGFIFVLSGLHVGVLNIQSVLLVLSLWLLLLIAVIDSNTQGIPDVLSFPFVLSAFLFHLVSGPFNLWAPFLAALFFALQWAVSGQKWVGSGDIILAAGIGFLVSRLELVLVFLFAAYVSGSIVATFLLLTKKKKRTDHLSFGPFLLLGTLCALLWGDLWMSLLLRA